jgi:hypothetical protein
MSAVSVYTYTHSVTYVADNILKSFRDIIRLSGLNPKELTDTWESNLKALSTWIESQDLEKVILEVYHPVSEALIVRWDLDIVYNWSTEEGTFYTDTDQLRYAIQKAGVIPSAAKYDILLKTKPGRPNVLGWGPGQYRSTAGMVKQSLGATVEHNGLGAQAAYWRKV